jgi:hypothetical protein
MIPLMQNVQPWPQIIIPAAAALLGVFVGGMITSHNQRKEREHRWFREQLGFYGRLLGMRMEILAKSEVRVRIRNLSQKAYTQELNQAGIDPEAKRLVSEKWEKYQKGLEYDNQQLTEELVPLYREILVLWNKNMALIESSTQKHYAAFVEYVEVWNRGLKDALVRDVIWEIEHDEKKLYPLYEDIERQVKRLREKLDE